MPSTVVTYLRESTTMGIVDHTRGRRTVGFNAGVSDTVTDSAESLLT
jgi:hypothetical protein